MNLFLAGSDEDTSAYILGEDGAALEEYTFINSLLINFNGK